MAVARVIDPALVECVAAPVAVELTGTHTRGATVVDLHRLTGAAANAQVATHLHRDTFWDLIVNAVRVLGRR